MTTDLDYALRTAGADLHLDRPAADILSRGDRLRRRRRSVRLGAPATALVAAGAAVALVLPLGSSPVHTDDAAQGRSVVTLSPDDLAEADQACKSMFKDMTDELTPDGQPVANITKDSRSVLLYRYNGRYADCIVQPSLDGSHLAAAGGSAGAPWLPLPAGRHFATLAGSFANDMSRNEIGELDGHLSQGISSFRIEPDVARLVLHVGDHDVDATVGDELAVALPPDGILTSEYDAATITAYAADGTELETRAILDSPAPEAD